MKEIQKEEFTDEEIYAELSKEQSKEPFEEQPETEESEDVLMQDSVDSPMASSIGTYFKDIGRINLLTNEEEVELCRRIDIGRKAQGCLEELPDPHGLYAERLKEDIAAGNDAKEKLIGANLRLVIPIAKHYMGCGLEMNDLIQEGNLGLMKAVDRFDYTKGYKLSTYATWWIRQHITRALADQSRTIRVPAHMVETINRYHRLKKQFLQENGREPSLSEVAEFLHVSEDSALFVMRSSQIPVSLDTHVGDDEDTEFMEMIEDDTAEDPFQAAASSEMLTSVRRVITTLDEKEQNIITLRFGLNGESPMTLEEVGAIYNVTRERIRQIEARALRKLRHPKRASELRAFIQN